MSGSGGGSGYNFQARAIAYVGAHILAQRRLDWIDHSSPDIPIIVATETGGPGDDLQITLQDGIKIEIQAKKKLQRDQKFWDALVRLASGISKDPYLHGVLLIGPKSTGQIKDALREDFEHLGTNGSGELKQITKEVIERFHQEGIECNPTLFRRLKLIQANFQDSTPEVKFACELLAQVICDSNEAKKAWKALDSEGHQLIELRGKLNAVDLTRRLSNIPIQLSTTVENLIIVAEHYKDWLRRTAVYFSIIGFNTKLSIESAWIQLQASKFKEFSEAFNADYIPDAYHRVVITAKSGSGKSTLLQRIAYRLSTSGKQVLWVRLPQAARYCQQGKPFGEAILTDASENSGLEISQLKRILANPDYLLVDGLDECDFTCLGIITQELLNWSAGHSDTKIIVTTRSESHSQELFPDWDHVEILPLSLQSIREFAQQLLEARFTDQAQIKEQLALFEERLAMNKTASLAAQNPLLAGFLFQLSIDDVELAQNRAELYERIIGLLYNQSSLNREFKIDCDRSTAFRIIEITGWILQNSSSISEDELIKELGKKLVDELDIKPLPAQRKAQKGLNFWKERRVLEYQKIGHKNIINFTHLSLQEYTAGKYVTSLSNQEQKEWLIQVRQESKWSEVILFASGAGSAQLIVNYLLYLNDLDESTLIELMLAAEALAETHILPLKLLNEVVKRLHLQLESPLSDRTLEAAEALSLLAFKAPDAVGTVLQSLVNHTHFWTRLSAMKILMVCGDSYVDLEILSSLLDEIFAEPAQAPGIFYKTKERKYKNWYFQNQVICQGFQLLLQHRSNLGVANQIWNFISKGVWSCGTNDVLRKLLFKLLEEKLENKESYEYEEWNVLRYKLIRPTLAQLVSENDPKNLLRRLRHNEQTKLADKIFLESVLHITNQNLVDELPGENARELVALGILLTSIGWWETPASDWNNLSNYNDLDSLKIVLKGMIAALGIALKELALDAQWVLRKMNSSGSPDLDSIELVLKSQDAESKNDEYMGAWSKLLEITKNDVPSYFYKIPKVFVAPKWGRTKEIDLDKEQLICAIKHPSEIIQYHAELLLLNGAVGDEAANLVRQPLKDD